MKVGRCNDDVTILLGVIISPGLSSPASPVKLSAEFAPGKYRHKQQKIGVYSYVMLFIGITQDIDIRIPRETVHGSEAIYNKLTIEQEICSITQQQLS